MIDLENKINELVCFVNEHFGGISEVRCLGPMSSCKIYFICSDFNLDRDQKILLSLDDVQAEVRLIPEDVKNMAIPEEAKVLWSPLGYIDNFRRSRLILEGSCPVSIMRNACKYIKEQFEANSNEDRLLKFNMQLHDIEDKSCDSSRPCVHSLSEVENAAKDGGFCRHDSSTFMWLSDYSAQKLSAVCQIYGIDLTPTYIKNMSPGNICEFSVGNIYFEAVKAHGSCPFAIICSRCNVAIRWINEPLAAAIEHVTSMHTRKKAT
jgi:hypothetical protein